jgi:signal transduction histidine kinase
MAGARGLMVNVESLDPMGAVLADPRRLEQVLLNLVSNSIKYNRPHGQIEISFTGPDAGSGRGRITVRDTGPGIAPDLQDRLFTPFDRLDAERNGESGAGLGLVVTERLVAAMGGTLQLHSRPGSGTTVVIDLEDAGPPA